MMRMQASLFGSHAYEESQPSAMCAMTAGNEKGVWTYLAQKTGPFEVGDVATALEIDPVLLGMGSKVAVALGNI